MENEVSFDYNEELVVAAGLNYELLEGVYLTDLLRLEYGQPLSFRLIF